MIGASSMMLMRCFATRSRAAVCHSERLTIFLPIRKLARSKFACDSGGASSSEVANVLVVEVFFIAICLSHRNDSDRFLALNMDNQDDEVVEQPDSDHSLFPVIEAIVFEQHHGPSEHLRGVGEVEPMLRQIRLSFRLIPCEVHLRIIHTIICIHNSAAVI